MAQGAWELGFISLYLGGLVAYYGEFRAYETDWTQKTPLSGGVFGKRKYLL